MGRPKQGVPKLCPSPDPGRLWGVGCTSEFVLPLGEAAGPPHCPGGRTTSGTSGIRKHFPLGLGVAHRFMERRRENGRRGARPGPVGGALTVPRLPCLPRTSQQTCLTSRADRPRFTGRKPRARSVTQTWGRGPALRTPVQHLLVRRGPPAGPQRRALPWQEAVSGSRARGTWSGCGSQGVSGSN